MINGYPVYIKENVESASLKGFELDLEGKINKSLKYFGNLTYTYGQNITKNEPLRRTPPTFGRIGMEFSKSSFILRPEFQFASAQKDWPQETFLTIELGQMEPLHGKL